MLSHTHLEIEGPTPSWDTAATSTLYFDPGKRSPSLAEVAEEEKRWRSGDLLPEVGWCELCSVIETWYS